MYRHTSPDLFRFSTGYSRKVTIIDFYAGRKLTVILQGLTPVQLSPKGGAEAVWSELLSLDVDRTYLSERLASLPKGECLGRLKVRWRSVVRNPCILRMSHFQLFFAVVALRNALLNLREICPDGTLRRSSKISCCPVDDCGRPWSVE